MCLMALPIFLNAQVIADKSFKMVHPKIDMMHNRVSLDTGNHILPVTLKQKISGLSVSGNITFTGVKGFVRIVLTDDYGNDYLVLETNTIFENQTTISFDEFCEETALLDAVLPKQITIECTDAQVTINGIQYATENEYQSSRDAQIKERQLNAKLQHINAILAQKEITWGAGKTSLSEMPYMEKKKLFGGKLPNLAGFDYYVGGIYVMQGYNPNNNSSNRPTISPFVSEFDWRNRHGRNWLTSVKQQGCGDCWAFASAGVTEAYVNMYYNRILNMDLSEQDLISCYQGDGCSGGTAFALNYIRDYGIVNEACFPYAASNLPCTLKCQIPTEKIKIANNTDFYTYQQTQDDLKRLIMRGPSYFSIPCWTHALVLVGYKTIQAGDRIFIKTATEDRWVTISSGDPLIGSNAWILKNSHGTSWGDNGVGYVVITWGEVGVTYVSGVVTSLNLTNAHIACEDRDGDGYYYWGVGPKPATCPACAPDEPDGDDSNSALGPMDEYGNCVALPYLPSFTTITTSQTWNTNKTVSNNIVIPCGVTLTITATAYLSNYTIAIRHGGKLILSGGIIDDGNIIVQKGSVFTISNNGKLLLGNYDNFNVELGAAFNLEYGEILLK